MDEKPKPVLSVPQSLLASVRQLVASEAIPLEVASAGRCTVRVEQGEARAECDQAVLHPGGWIACPTAQAAASRLQISNRAMGRILNLLEIKIRQCDLGCFP